MTTAAERFVQDHQSREFAEHVVRQRDGIHAASRHRTAAEDRRISGVLELHFLLDGAADIEHQRYEHGHEQHGNASDEAEKA